MPKIISYRKREGITRTTSMKVVKRFRWSMAHRLTHGYEGSCASLHGHEYEVEVTVAGEVDAMGLAVDFADVKRACQGWIKEHLDHTTIVCREDETLLDFLREEKQRHYVVDFNTTAENIAVHLREELQKALDRVLDRKLSVVHIRLLETPSSWVEVP
ncbi:MAG: 6-carboxytetrahydropterin synthase [Fidelibacterota bacterium]|nr:MAG: 6-carboxytetrahydropterin synthase [Candidatus Neomarinimicrobiota bacterium]